MAGGGVAVGNDTGRGTMYKGKTTMAVIVIALVAACGGLLFGYDIGVTGGVISMTGFAERFFPQVSVIVGISGLPVVIT